MNKRKMSRANRKRLDMFAAAALTGYCMNKKASDTRSETLAMWAFNDASAMLEAREEEIDEWELEGYVDEMFEDDGVTLAPGPVKDEHDRLEAERDWKAKVEAVEKLCK